MAGVELGQVTLHPMKSGPDLLQACGIWRGGTAVGLRARTAGERQQDRHDDQQRAGSTKACHRATQSPKHRTGPVRVVHCNQGRLKNISRSRLPFATVSGVKTL